MDNGLIMKIIAFILRLIAEGLDPSAAIKKASLKFGVSESEILKHYRK